uniref:Putative cadherin egf lag seven-pass g-type receptor n=1 Tax=Corethrella appendiculata TaxID=1370023 RepID=W4VR90_9DIPT
MINSKNSFLFKIVLILIFYCNFVVCNRPPRFMTEGHSEIVLRLKEGVDTPIGTLIYKLKGYDPDGDPLTFGVRTTLDSDIIRIEKSGVNEANLYLDKELDREAKDEYSLILTLTDDRLGEGNFVTQSLLVLVEDVNDNEPIFKPFQSALEVAEDSRPGILTTVEATDRDEGAYGQVVYYIQELDGDNDVFTISTMHGKGVIRLAGSLDYERKSLYQLRVLAVDRANQGKINTATAALLVKVKDIEDQPPEFAVVSAVTRVSEDAPIGTKVLQVKAIDGDRGVNNRIRYSITKGSSGLFAIDEDLGVIYTTKTLDREDTRNQINGAYILEILATERSKIKPPPSVRTEVTIILTDVNDEKPTFRNKKYECEINENAQENTPVAFIGDVENDVYDHDQGNNGTFELHLEPPNDIFEITPKRSVNEATFILRVRNPKMLDYEKLKIINLTIVAKEVVPNGKLSTVPILVHIRDQNDNFPEFTKQIYESYIPENSGIGVTIAEVKAFDQDSGDYGTKGIRYINLSGSIADLLNLDSVTGVIKIKSAGGHAFDRELITKHYLTVEARDNLGRGNRNTVQLIINIQDVNDNPPIFLQNKYEARLLENKINFETPLIVEAKDLDLNGTKNSEITYEIIEGQFRDNFTLNRRTGKIEPTTPIDFEQLSRSSYNIRPIHLTVQASDSGVPSLTAKVSVIIYVQDVNDHAPKFIQSNYMKSIPEDLPSGTSILEVKAYDNDGSNPNNFVIYRIQSGASDKFVISPDTGIISVAVGASLDPDLTDPITMQYSLTVIALDGGIGDQQLQSSCIVNITILDVNNKSPTFSDPGTVSVKENTPVGTYAYRLIANDLDENPILRYYLDAKTSEARNEDGAIVKVSEYDYLSAFDLNSLDGLIRVVKLIDREKVETIKLGFIVEDVAAENGKQTATAVLSITIEDENDNNPKFRKPFYKRSITENSPNGVTITSVVAYDVDKNKTIRYSLEGPQEMTALVHLDAESGEIVVANRIDHETFQWLNFTVRATDSGVPPRSSMVDVFVQVVDENDNNPYFIGDMGNLTVYENSPIGTRIATIQANDADSGDFGKITYLIDRISSQGKFSIDPDTGVLVVADALDRETKNSYMVVIEAWDNYQFGYLSGESRNAFKQIFITVLDENDSPPNITMPTGCVQVTEFHDIKEPITKLKATDADDPALENGMVEFELMDSSGLDLFMIDQNDPWNAIVYARRSLNNLYGNYSLLITVRDRGSPPNILNEKLDICVLDFNDHAPIFLSPANNVTIRVPENATVGTQIIQVVATDDDVGANAAVRYRMKPDPMGNFRTFAIDEMTGSISLKLPLDRERQKIYEIRIEAFDQGVPTPLSTDLDLTIYVRNVNDYEPQFLVEEISVNFTEHSKPGMERKKLPDTVDRDEVDDLDDPPSNVCYFIVYGNDENYFKLDPETHILSLLRELDREVKPNHTLIIKATEDCLNPPEQLQKTHPQALKMDFNQYFNRNYKMSRSSNNKFFDFYDRYKNSRSLTFNDDELGVDSLQMNIETENPYFEKYTSQILYSEDNTLVRVVIYVQDINDNPPQFIRKIFTGGVTTSSDFGTQFMFVTAVDKDEGVNGKITYYQIGEIKKTLTEGLENLQKQPFLVDIETGAVQLNFDPQKGMKGYFDFMVLANDTYGFQDVAHVFIYLLREDQRVKFVLRQQPHEVRERINLFRETLSNVSDRIVNVDDFKIHENKDGSVDKTKTDLYLHLVDKKDNSILEVSDVLKLVDQNIERLDELFKEFNVLDTQASEALLLATNVSGGPVLIWLLVSNLFIGALLIVVLVLCASQRSNYRRQLRAARVNTFTNQSDITPRGITARVPNTNKHSVEGSNPMWLKAYENEWFKNDEDFSQNGPDSLDENVIAAEEYLSKTNKEFNGLNTQNNLIRQYNVYQQIDKLTNGNLLTKKLETTEL